MTLTNGFNTWSEGSNVKLRSPVFRTDMGIRTFWIKNSSYPLKRSNIIQAWNTKRVDDMTYSCHIELDDKTNLVSKGVVSAFIVLKAQKDNSKFPLVDLRWGFNGNSKEALSRDFTFMRSLSMLYQQFARGERLEKELSAFRELTSQFADGAIKTTIGHLHYILFNSDLFDQYYEDSDDLQLLVHLDYEPRVRRKWTGIKTITIKD